MIFSGEEPSPLHLTASPFDTYGASPPPYWNPKYATGVKRYLQQR